jgi:hypothetical protein
VIPLEKFQAPATKKFTIMEIDRGLTNPIKREPINKKF